MMSLMSLHMSKCKRERERERDSQANVPVAPVEIPPEGVVPFL